MTEQELRDTLKPYNQKNKDLVAKINSYIQEIDPKYTLSYECDVVSMKRDNKDRVFIDCAILIGLTNIGGKPTPFYRMGLSEKIVYDLTAEKISGNMMTLGTLESIGERIASFDRYIEAKTLKESLEKSLQNSNNTVKKNKV